MPLPDFSNNNEVIHCKIEQFLFKMPRLSVSIIPISSILVPKRPVNTLKIPTSRRSESLL